MARRDQIGGVIHVYQKYDPQRFPSPLQEPPDVVSAAFEHLLYFGDAHELTEEELARAVRLDPSQIQGLGPSLDSLIRLLLERKRKILSTYETDTVLRDAARRFAYLVRRARPPRRMAKRFHVAVQEEQLYDLERLWYQSERDEPKFARRLLYVMEALGHKYEIEELASKYEFTGRQRLSVSQALAVKQELEEIDRLLEQLRRAAETAQLAIIDLEALSQYAQEEQIAELNRLQQMVEEYLRQLAQAQGLHRQGNRLALTPRAYRLFQDRLLQRIFSQLRPGRSGRHQGPIEGEGAVELPQTKPYEFGDSVAQMDIPASMLNALIRSGPGVPVQMLPEDIEIHRTRNRPKCATVVVMDMSGSMRYEAQYVNVKRMALALQGLIHREYPGDYLQFVEMYTFARVCPPDRIVSLLPKIPSLHDPVVRLRADMSRPDITELDVPQHFTNIQHALELAGRLLEVQDTPNRQIVLITDGLPTAHFEGPMLYLLYPPDARTETATLRQGLRCAQAGITINVFLLPSWAQSREDIQFAYRLAESTRGRVFFTAGRDLDRYVVWDYLQRRREIIQ